MNKDQRELAKVFNENKKYLSWWERKLFPFLGSNYWEDDEEGGEILFKEYRGLYFILAFQNKDEIKVL